MIENICLLYVLFLAGIITGLIGVLILWLLFEIIEWTLVIGLFIKELYED